MGTEDQSKRKKKDKNAKKMDKEIVKDTNMKNNDQVKQKINKSKKKKKDRAKEAQDTLTLDGFRENTVETGRTSRGSKIEQENEETSVKHESLENEYQGKKSRKSNKKKKKEVSASDDLNSSHIVEDFNEERKNKRKKKVKESTMNDCLENSDSVLADSDDPCSPDETTTFSSNSKKKKKKKKAKSKFENSLGEKLESADDANCVEREEDVNKEHKKKRKLIENDDNKENGNERKRKKKKKNKEKIDSVENDVICTKLEEDVKDDKLKLKDSGKKEKKRKITSDVAIDVENMNEDVPVKKKKKKKSKEVESDAVKDEGKVKVTSHEEGDNKICNYLKKLKKQEEDEKSDKKSSEVTNNTAGLGLAVAAQMSSAITSVTPKVAWGTPVFESEERVHKFNRLLGGNKLSSAKASPILSSPAGAKADVKPAHSQDNGNSQNTSTLSAGQWKGNLFENEDRQNKFIRLLGGAKSDSNKKKSLFSPSSSGSKKGLFGSLSSLVSANTNTNSLRGGSHALNIESAATLNQQLEKDYNQALCKKLGGLGAAGIGYVRDPAEGKTFHIDSNATKSIHFSDDDE